jgi:hypothetical protein
LGQLSEHCIFRDFFSGLLSPTTTKDSSRVLVTYGILHESDARFHETFLVFFWTTFRLKKSTSCPLRSEIKCNRRIFLFGPNELQLFRFTDVAFKKKVLLRAVGNWQIRSSQDLPGGFGCFQLWKIERANAICVSLGTIVKSMYPS